VEAGAGTDASTSQTVTTSAIETTSATGTTSATDSTGDTDANQATAAPSGVMYVSFDSEDEDATWDVSEASVITLKGSSISLDGPGATVDGSDVMITSEGTYVITGTLNDGQVIVDSQDNGTVRLVLNGAQIACSNSSPIYIKNADKAIITLAEGTENVVTDGDSYVLEDSASDEPDAAIFSKADLTINGTGSLAVSANYNNGISSKDDLKIVSGDMTVDAVNDALKGKDCIGVKDGTITVTAGADGLQSTNDVDTEKGYISIEGGTLDITAGNDGIQAQTTLTISGGDFTITTGGGSANAAGQTGNDWGQNMGGDRSPTTTTDSTTTTESNSAKGLKGGTGVYVEDGAFTIDSADDTVHSNSEIEISGGDLTLSSGDDGIHADTSVTIDGGDISITRSYEGIESNLVTLNDGTIHVISSDDGINGVSNAAASSAGGATGQGQFGESGNAQLTVNGGYTAVDAGGDGLDINGTVQMADGKLIINGPTENMNGALDYYSQFTVTGGYLVAVGSSGMAEAPSESSTLHSILVNLSSAQAAGTLVHIQAEDGTDVLTFAPTKQYQSVVLCSPGLKDGGTYTVYLGGSSTGTATDGLYSGGTYTPGTDYASLTLASMVTTSGQGGMMGGMQGGGMPLGGTGRTRPSGAPGGGPGGTTSSTTGG
jgi:hypothetical protein